MELGDGALVDLSDGAYWALPVTTTCARRPHELAVTYRLLFDLDVQHARWAVAFALGLLHGFGFSSVLVDLGLPSRELIGALLGFNAGVELGQAALVIVVLPVLFAMRRTLAYRALLWAGSGTVALVAAVWSYQRCFI